ncbi:MAG: hypothetical protein GX314_02860 [Clostridiaceae bacterium]|nr:hypothetical protein [Clostridiaceae bacterium]
MKYLILECTENDAIALDDEGRFLRVINNDYQVGQKVERVTLSLTNSRRPSRIVYFARSLSAVAASLILAFFIYYLVALRPVSTINLAINPEVTIKLNSRHKVISLQAENQDAENIIADYSYRGKTGHQVVLDLVSESIRQDFLSDGGRVLITGDLSGKIVAEEWAHQLQSDIDRLLYRNNIHIALKIGVYDPSLRWLVDYAYGPFETEPEPEEPTNPESDYNSFYDDDDDDTDKTGHQADPDPDSTSTKPTPTPDRTKPTPGQTKPTPGQTKPTPKQTIPATSPVTTKPAPKATPTTAPTSRQTAAPTYDDDDSDYDDLDDDNNYDDPNDDDSEYDDQPDDDSDYDDD